MDDFRYVGPHDVHDGKILSVDQTDDTVAVKVRSMENREFCILFHGVTKVESETPAGMLLYALGRRGSTPPYEFDFRNWYDPDEDKSYLTITAVDFEEIDCGLQPGDEGDEV